MDFSFEIVCYIAALAVLLWNIATFAMYGMDKGKAKSGKWRIKESTLITCAFLMGGIGAALGMSVFRHKTNVTKFKVMVPLAIVINIGVVVGVLYIAGVL